MNLNILMRSLDIMRIEREVMRIERIESMQKRNFINHLKNCGIKLCHPNDGWNNREEHILIIANPLFCENYIKVGDKIVIETDYRYNDFQVAKILKIKEITCFIYIYYEILLPKKPRKSARYIRYFRIFKSKPVYFIKIVFIHSFIHSWLAFIVTFLITIYFLANLLAQMR